MDMRGRQADYTGPIASQGASGSASASGGASAASAKRAAGGGGAVRWTYTMVLAATGVPQAAPGYLVPPGCMVRLRANSGGAGGNAATVWVAEYRDRVANGLGIPMLPLDDIQLQVGNTANIWAKGTAGDAIVISVQSVVAGL